MDTQAHVLERFVTGLMARDGTTLVKTDPEDVSENGDNRGKNTSSLHIMRVIIMSVILY